MTSAIVVENLRPATPGGYAAKAIAGEPIPVSADIFRDGHDILAAEVVWGPLGAKPKTWASAPMHPGDNHRWSGTIAVGEPGAYRYLVRAWTDRPATWRRAAGLKLDAGQDIEVELEEGARMLEAAGARLKGKEAKTVARLAAELRERARPPGERLEILGGAEAAPLLASRLPRPDLTSSPRKPLWVDRPRAQFSTWYELFPRSYGGFEGTTKRLSAVAEMGFDVAYLPPVHPIGSTDRKGRNNSVTAGPDDVGSPWAIGSPEGGHTAIEPSLGTFEDFAALVDEAGALGMEVALDYALQCSPDHPWVSEHPEWFHHRPDGSIKFAENPPKKYQDIYPINFWPPDDGDRRALWEACRQILDFWIARGVKIFRVDNPHTKPLALWEWMIAEVQRDHPDVLFLAEAFTHPKMMARLAEVGFSQSYTYFTWRNTKDELLDYLQEVSLGPAADYMRPNFWPNTPDILSGPLRRGGPEAFRLRLFLAATMCSSYGIYSGYELCENEPARETDEEYLNSEKYEIKERDFDSPGSLAPFITRINAARRSHPALQQMRRLAVHPVANDRMLAFSKRSADGADTVLVVANLDLTRWQETTLTLDAAALGVDPSRPYRVEDLMTGDRYTWTGTAPYVRLDPRRQPGHLFRVTQDGTA